jgi:hypothetical protein
MFTAIANEQAYYSEQGGIILTSFFSIYLVITSENDQRKSFGFTSITCQMASLHFDIHILSSQLFSSFLLSVTDVMLLLEMDW